MIPQEWIDIKNQCPVSELYEQVLAFEDGAGHDERSCKIGVVLLSALFVGASVDAVAYHTEYDLEFIKNCAINFYENGIWIDGKTSSEWVDHFCETGEFNFEAIVDFWLCTLCGDGAIKRCSVKQLDEPVDEVYIENNPQWITDKYNEIESYIQKLDANKEYRALTELREKFNLSSYRHAYFYERLKLKRQLHSIKRGFFKIGDNPNRPIVEYITDGSLKMERNNYIEYLEENVKEELDVIIEDIYDWTLTLDRKKIYAKTIFEQNFSCQIEQIIKAIKWLQDDGIIKDGVTNEFFIFTDKYNPKEKSDYFQIDEQKEVEYKERIKPYVQKDDRPMPDYLKP